MSTDPLPDVPTARDAQRRSDAVRSERNQAFRARCLRLLHEAIESGRREALLPHPLPADLEQELLQKGYRTGKPYQSDWNETSVKVFW